MISILLPSSNEPETPRLIDDIERLFNNIQIIVFNDHTRRGKGWAIREALAQAKGDLICFLDGDGDIPARMIRRLIPFLDDYDVVIGKKDHKHLLSRQILTGLSRCWIHALFGIYLDTQTGIKLFRRESLPEWRSDGWMFDLEIIAKCLKNGERIVEVPVDVKVTRKAKINSILKCFLESARIKWDLANHPQG